MVTPPSEARVRSPAAVPGWPASSAAHSRQRGGKRKTGNPAPDSGGHYRRPTVGVVDMDQERARLAHRAPNRSHSPGSGRTDMARAAQQHTTSSPGRVVAARLGPASRTRSTVWGPGPAPRPTARARPGVGQRQSTSRSAIAHARRARHGSATARHASRPGYTGNASRLRAHQTNAPRRPRRRPSTPRHAREARPNSTRLD